jgi:nucleotide-binding universal stress UspA family protein
MRTRVAHGAARAEIHDASDSGPAGRVLVAVSDSASSFAAVGVGVLLARQRGSVLRILAVAPPVPMGVSCAPIALPWAPDQLESDALQTARELSAQARQLVGEGVCVHVSAACGRPKLLIAALVETGLFTAIVVPGQWAGRPGFRWAASRWRRSGVELHAVWS